MYHGTMLKAFVKIATNKKRVERHSPHCPLYIALVLRWSAEAVRSVRSSPPVGSLTMKTDFLGCERVTPTSPRAPGTSR